MAARRPTVIGVLPFPVLVMIAPSLLLAAFVILYPLWEILRLSVHEISRFGLGRGFVGWDNFTAVLADPSFRASLWRTLVWTGAVVGGTLVVSVPTAVILNMDFAGRGLARAVVMLPWSVSLSMASIVWLWSFNADYGLINTLLQSLGLIARGVPWMARPETAFPIEIAIGVIVSIPFTTTILLGGLSSIPGDIYEAARIDGAGPWLQFRALTLPLLRSFINIAVVLNIIHVFNSFPIIWIMTQGGPDDGTHILITYLYDLAFRLGKPGPAAAISLIMLAILFVFTFLYLRLQPKDAN